VVRDVKVGHVAPEEKNTQKTLKGNPEGRDLGGDWKRRVNVNGM
jgi:hypothetical protein